MTPEQPRILVATDLTERSSRAFARATLLARELNARLRVVHVVDEALPAALKAQLTEWARQTLSREIDQVAGPAGVKAELDVLAGNPRMEIARLAGSTQTDLLVLGTHDPASPRAKSFAETTAGGGLGSTHHAALLVKDAASEPYRKVVVGVDFSMFSLAALRHAMRIAPAARLHLVHVYQMPFPGFLGGAQVEHEVAYAERLEFNAFLEDEMKAVERRAQQQGRTPGDIEKTVREGDPREVLRDVCIRTGADLLAIGTHGRGCVGRAIWGSVAVDILDNPPCDVLIVRPL